MLAAFAIAPCQADDQATRNFSVTTDPSGAAVWVMGEKVGTTPLRLRERAIYPNDFPDDRAHLYGVITLRRDGCDNQLYRVKRNDISNGLNIDLACRPRTVTASFESPHGPGSGASAVQTPGEETTSEKKLRQLRVLQELLDEGLITTDEERSIRRRIFDAP